MSFVPILPDRLDWSSAIGLFLINFGTLDHLVFVFLKDHLSSDEFAKIKEWHLNDRLDGIERFMREENYPAEDQAAFAELLKRLKPIRDLRNHIAHGHMFVSLGPATQKPTVTLVKAKDLDTWSSSDSKRVEFAELEKALSTLTGLVEEFKRLAGFKP